MGYRVGSVSANCETVIMHNLVFWPLELVVYFHDIILNTTQVMILQSHKFKLQGTVKPALCGLCHERPLILNYRFHMHVCIHG